jgi:hypothetical protein
MCFLGKAIRHIGDYVAILLVDTYYTSRFGPQGPNASPLGLASKFPRWIEERLVNVTGNFGEMHRLLHQFFKLNQQRCKLVPLFSNLENKIGHTILLHVYCILQRD